MDRTISASRLLDPLVAQWQEPLQKWALDGSISSSAQEALHKDGQPPLLAEPAIGLVARPFAPDYTTRNPFDLARRVCGRAWSAERELGLSEP